VSPGGSTPFRLNLHVSDVGHTLVLGPTGAGKSTLLGLIQAQFFRYPDAQVFTFDKGYSSFPLVAACGGHHYDIAADSLDALAFYPLASIDRPTERAWAAEWIETLMALQGVVVTPAHRGAIDHALGLLAASPSRTLTDLQVKLQDPNLRQALRPYTLKGNFGALLDAQSDGLRDGRFQVFEMAHLMELGDRIVIPALLYLFHRIEQRLDGRPTLIILEEAWTYLLHELFAERIQLWLKELRKYNAAVVFVTQSLADIHASSKRHVIYESCPTKILLPNSEAGSEQGAAIYRAIGLNDREIEIVARSAKKRDYYYTSPLGNRLMDLTLGPLALAFVGATGREDLRAIRELRAMYGPEWPRAWVRQRGLDRWADQLADRATDRNERSLACAG
jgi:type IV secretion system protein TrbE